MHVEIEHYGGEKKSVEVLTVSKHYKEIQVMWTGTTNERVTFSLRNGLIIAPTAQPDANVPIGLVRARRARGKSPPNTRNCAREWFGPYMALFPSWLRTAGGGGCWFCWDSRTGRVVVRSMITLRKWRQS